VRAAQVRRPGSAFRGDGLVGHCSVIAAFHSLVLRRPWRARRGARRRAGAPVHLVRVTGRCNWCRGREHAAAER
jgi:hypothetical protein